MSDHYQVVVIGSGSGGREAALLAARKGLRTAVIERNQIGGTSFHRGCYAVKALQGCARQFRDSWTSGRFGNQIDLLKATLYDWIVAQSKTSSRLADNLQAEFRQLNVELFTGHGEFLDSHTIQIFGERGSVKTIAADNVIVATGSRPEFYGSSIPGMVNSEELLRITTLPERLVVIGGGYIGCEFASIYRTLGCEVTLIERKERVLPGWELEAGKRVEETLKKLGVRIILDHHISFPLAEAAEDRVSLQGPNGQTIEADLVLVATGRKPNTENIGLDAIGIEGGSFLEVDSRMRVAESGIYAVGDVNGISMLDSTAFSQANVAVHSILGSKTRYDRRWIPRCVHTEPCLASIGWTEYEATAEGFEYAAVSDEVCLPSDSKRSVVDPEKTFIKIIIDVNSRHLLGCLVAGDHAPVIVNLAAIAMRAGLTVEKLCELPFIQPSASESLIGTLRKAGL
jgi:dihydrolipoamide dehydrogenase